MANLIDSSIRNNLQIKELKEYVNNDKQLKRNIISSCNMYCGKYYIHMDDTIKKYFKKKGNKEIYVIVKDDSNHDKLKNILGYCITTYTQDFNKYLIKIYRNNEFLGYRYVSERNVNELLGNKYQKLHTSQLKIVKINVICALTPDEIPILPIKKLFHKSMSKSLLNIIKYVKDRKKYYRNRKYYQLNERINKIPKLGTYFLEEILKKFKSKNIDIVKLSSLHLNNTDNRTNFYMRHGFKYSLNWYNHIIMDYQYRSMILDMNNICVK